ncbi:hypothetical protein [Embleya sp. MST-111070]|uniref:hypothetical protein n=1 Tax=Embleya sp. MST-111070 TaxID=3398231 RepID=UPI003F7395DD
MRVSRSAGLALVAPAVLVLGLSLVACGGDSGGNGVRPDGSAGVGSGSGALADLPPVLAGATRIAAEGRGADPQRRLDGAGDQEAVTILREEMEFLGYTDLRDPQGGYYTYAAPSGKDATESDRIVVITAERGHTSPLDWFARIADGAEKDRADNPAEPGDRHVLESANGGRIGCDSSPARPASGAGTTPQRPHASCIWADGKHLVSVSARGADIPAVRAMIDTIRTGGAGTAHP